MTVAIAITATELWRGRTCQMTSPNDASPIDPRLAPRASILAANLPRIVPSAPISDFFLFSLLSIMVALAGKIAGNARKRPPIPGPYRLAMTPAIAVQSPPKTKRATYSCVRVSRRDARLKPIFFIGCLPTIAKGQTIQQTTPGSRWMPRGLRKDGNASAAS
jgi:hypothetical protein